MNRTTVLSLNKVGLFKNFNKNRAFILTALLFILGIVLGCVLYSDSNKIGDISAWLFNRYIEKRETLEFFRIFFTSVFSNLLILILIYLCGVSVMGIVVSPFLLLWLGIFYGGICADLYSTFTLKGIAFNATVFIPSTIIVILIYILAVKEAVKFSKTIAGLTLPRNRPMNLSEEFKAFSVKYIIYFSFLILNGLIDSARFCGFYKFFNL